MKIIFIIKIKINLYPKTFKNLLLLNEEVIFVKNFRRKISYFLKLNLRIKTGVFFHRELCLKSFLFIFLIITKN